MVEYGILGPLQVSLDGVSVAVAGDRRRALLARLLVAHGRAVPVDVLIDDLWAGAPPASADATLQSHVSALRRAIGVDRIERVGRSYQLGLQRDDLDAWLAETDLATSRLRMELGDHTHAVAAVERALGRWRGAPLADVATQPWARPEVTRCVELRVQCLETWLQAQLALNRPELVVAQAEVAVAEYPLREHLWGQLMVALYRSGRQADALRAYQRLRVLLAEELGLDPSPQLVELEGAILRQDSSLNAVDAEFAAFRVADTRQLTAAYERPKLVSAEAGRPHRGGVRTRGTAASVASDVPPLTVAPPPTAGPPLDLPPPQPSQRPRRRSTVITAVVASVAGAVALAAIVVSISRDRASPTAGGRAPGTTANAGSGSATAPSVATGTAPSGKVWQVVTWADQSGEICTRLKVVGGPVSRDVCERRLTDKTFGLVRVFGFTDSDAPTYISWFLIADQAAKVDATTSDGSHAGTADIVVEEATHARYGVSYADRSQQLTFVAFDAHGQRLGELDVPPPRPLR